MDSYLQGQGVQFTSSRVTANYTNLGFNSIWLHPRAMKGAFTQLSQVLHPENPWPPRRRHLVPVSGVSALAVSPANAGVQES